MTHSIYAIEGLDRLGKSTLIGQIEQNLGHFEVIHYGKPKILRRYQEVFPTLHEEAYYKPDNADAFAKYMYQRSSFTNSMLLAKSGARLIFDRWHLGEAVYAPLYRGYDGDYVFELEKRLNIKVEPIRLILLTEDFMTAKHFQSDGESFDDMNRKNEQALFIAAFNKSHIRDKKIVVVTDKSTGQFRSPEEIFKEAIA